MSAARRPWLASELAEAKRWYLAGLSHRQIGARLDRSVDSVRSALRATNITKGRHPVSALAPHALAAAKLLLAREIAAARAEVPHCKPYKGTQA